MSYHAPEKYGFDEEKSFPHERHSKRWQERRYKHTEKKKCPFCYNSRWKGVGMVLRVLVVVVLGVWFCVRFSEGFGGGGRDWEGIDEGEGKEDIIKEGRGRELEDIGNATLGVSHPSPFLSSFY